MVSLLSLIQVTQGQVTIPEGGDLRVGLVATGPVMYLEGRGVTAAGPIILLENLLRLAHETGARQAPNGTLIPLIISSWSVSADGLEYTFTIRNNARWSDGTDVTTDDITFTYDVIQAVPEIDEWGIRPYIDRIEVVDSKHFKVHLKEPFSPFLVYWLALTPMPKHFWKTVDLFLAPNSTRFTETIGTGPFKIVGFTPGDTVVRLVPNQYYWGPKPHISSITVTLLSPDANIPALMAAGEFDIVEVPSPAQVPSLVGLTNVTIKTFSTHPYGAWQMSRWGGILVNNLKYPLSEEALRQAIAYGLDRKQVVDLAASGYGTVASYGFLPSDFGEWLAPGLPTYQRNVTRAKALISSLGFVLGTDGFWRYANGTRLTLEIMARPGGETLIATVVAQQLKDIGLEVVVRSLSSAVYVNNYGYGYYDMGVILTNHPLSMDFVLNKFYYPQLTPIGQTIYYRGWTRWASARYGELMTSSRQASDPAQLHSIYDEAQGIIAEELPFVSLYYARHIWAHRTDTFEGWEPMEKGFNWPMSELLLSLHLPAVPAPAPEPGLPIWVYGVVGLSMLIAAAAVIYAVRRR